MKKLLTLLSFVLVASFSFAQPPGGGNAEQMKQRMKERIKPVLLEKVKITDEQADKVIDAYFDARRESMKVMRNEELTMEEKETKMKEINNARDKKLKDAGLTDEQIKTVATLFEEMRKQRGGPQDGDRPRD